MTQELESPSVETATRVEPARAGVPVLGPSRSRKLIRVLSALSTGLILALGAVVFASSGSGRAFWAFMLSARQELRKVVWPTRQETGMTTAVVFGFVVIAGLFFWGLAVFLSWATRLLTGQGS